MTTMNELLDEAYRLMRRINDMEDNAVIERRTADTERLNAIYFKANRRWWRRYHRQKQLLKLSKEGN